ncbi:hypothetical protein [Paenibacillus planticolens]|uniref:Immunity protein 30 domain-containing protein n=1 Tax=Paenibacillus planticolens TaxID=2654976 RepID=A0ABX1ZR81_9BACL|nr:hypothetical protein [Paenibacillus planticolens]NOV01565.1 hypothetical protein [Paenibacillus planticolens]
MSGIAELVKQLDNDTIANEDLIICMKDYNYGVIVKAMFKAIERYYCNDEIVNRLAELSNLMKDSKFIGPWQMGHVALATLSILDNDGATKKFSELVENLSENDKFLVENFIKTEAYKE